ncbi:MAG TPA: DUF5666 domain-containing protein [Armatimonadota bacterium]|nr:DUF5666 domain-containing protein [Armatimonadota bacterium]
MNTTTKHIQALVLAVASVAVAAPGVRAQIFNRPPISAGSGDTALVNAVGRVASVSGNDNFTLEVRRMTFRVSWGQRARFGNTPVRVGDRVRVAGELVEQDRLVVDSVEVVQRGSGGGNGGPGQANVVTGTIRTIDREEQRMVLTTTGGGTVRVSWNPDTEFIRNTVRSGPREFRVGDAVRVVGRREGGNEVLARRVFFGANGGWVNNRVGEIVGLDSRAREAEVSFEGQVVTVRLQNATIRRAGRELDLNDLRLGQDVRVAGTARGANAVDATLVEIVRAGRGGDRDDDDRPGAAQTLEGRIVNVAEGVRSFRISVQGTGDAVRVETNEETNFIRAGARIGFTQLREDQRVRVRVRREGNDWIATRVEVL